jgi:methyl-accepting chemotaxis protein
MALQREAQSEQETEQPPGRRGLRLGLLGKIVVFLVAALVPLAAVTWYVSARSIRTSMTEEFVSKGEAIASSLASSGVDLISTRDASSVQSLVDEFARIRGVAYVMVYDPQKKLIAHTFSPSVPAGIIDKNIVPGNVARQHRDIEYQEPARKGHRDIIDIGVPMAAGKLGTVRVGMDRAIIDHAAAASGRQLLLVFAGVAALTVIGGAWLARRITRPITRLVEAAQRVGEGDLSETVAVTSRDEIGDLAQTFNHTIVRLRDQLHTESERDDERKRREDLQENIIKFLDVAMEVSQGDLTKRGEVTSDVLGNVVDAINLMVAEIGAIIADVRVAAMQVSASASQMTDSSGRMTEGAQAQAREASQVAASVEALTRSVRQVAESARASAQAAREALDAAQKGDIAVRDSLQGMQRIRGEVQSISKKIKSLGDRSLEISEIVNTIEDIASQTNLVALNAAIEAAGACADQECPGGYAGCRRRHGAGDTGSRVRLSHDRAGWREPEGHRGCLPALGRAGPGDLRGDATAGAKRRERHAGHAVHPVSGVADRAGSARSPADGGRALPSRRGAHGQPCPIQAGGVASPVARILL